MTKRKLRVALATTAATAAATLTLITGSTPAEAATVAQVVDCGSLGGTQTMNMITSAPATVASGGTFTVSIAPQSAKADGAAIKNLEWAYQAPTGSTIVAGSAKTVGTGTTSGGKIGTPTAAVSGSVAFLRVPGEIASGATFTPPALEFQLTATAPPGTTLPVKVRTSGTAYKLTAMGSINVSCNAKSPVVTLTSTQIQAAATTTTTTGSTSSTTPGSTTPGTTTTTAPPVITTQTWVPAGSCGAVTSTPVPEHTTSMAITAVGGKGGKGGEVASATGGSGAAGSQVTTTVTNPTATTISAIVGCDGANGSSSSGTGGLGFGKGGNGGLGRGTVTANHYGGGGGGASAVCAGTACQAGFPGLTPLVVAGGGGAGGSLNCAGTSVGKGGAGGAGDSSSGGGGVGPSGLDGSNGASSTGGTGGTNNGGGSPDGGTGGNGTNSVGNTNSGGGGGGGGYAGGRGGTGTNGGLALCVGGGGGGGGSSWTVNTATGTDVQAASTSPAVKVVFTIATPPKDPDPLPGAVYVPMVPCRLFDSRMLAGTEKTMKNGESAEIQITGRAGCNVPAKANAIEASVSAVDELDNGYARLWATGSTMPVPSFLNYVKGQGTTNTGATPISSSGQATIRNFGGPAVLVVDVQGYYINQADMPQGAAGSVYVAMQPCRAYDSRTSGGLLKNGDSRPVQVTGNSDCLVPAKATGIEAGVTVVDTAKEGYGRLWPSDEAAPTATFVKYSDQQKATNTGALTLSATGAVTLKNFGGSGQYVVDVMGYFIKPADLATGVKGATYRPVDPCRAYDSRTGHGVFKHNDQADITLTGVCGVAADATAVEATVGAVTPTASGYTRAWRQGDAPVMVTVLNYVKDLNNRNTGSISLSATGALSLRNITGTTDYVIDTQGYWTTVLTGA